MRYSSGHASYRYVAAALYISMMSSGLQAEVVLDGSLGAAGALSGPNYAITEDLGQTHGTNLFHSFSDFNLNSSESATFSGSSSITNIISRVTGGNPSSIDGAINSSIDGANLYLINPSGVMFGENASLNISGSFYATTADYVTLGSDGRFDASAPSNSVLTMSTPSAFGFVDANIAPITITRSIFTLSQGETLALIGGDITLMGQNIDDGYWDIDVPSGQVQLISLASAGIVDVSGTTPVMSGFQQLGNILLSDYYGISTSGDPGGTIFIRGGQLVIDGGILSSATMGATDHPGVGIDIAVTGDVAINAPDPSIDNGSEIVSSSFGGGNAGAVVIDAGRVILNGDLIAGVENPYGHYSAIASRAWAEGDSADITINADEIQLGVNSQIASDSQAAGNAGNIAVNSNTISLIATAGAGTRISSTAFSTGNAGNLDITATDINLQGGANGFVGFTSQVADISASAAVSGNITVSTNNLNIQDGAQISANVFSGSGYAGDIVVTADQINISGVNGGGYSSGIFTATNGFYTTGNAGNIDISTQTLTLSAGGRIDNSAYSWGGAGTIDILADTVQIYGAGIAGISSGLFSISGWVASHGGNINVTAENLSLIDGGVINTQTVGTGNGGNVNVNVGELHISGIDSVNSLSSQIVASTEIFYYPAYALGDGGNIAITASRVDITDSGSITTASASSGNGGNVTLNTNALLLGADSQITSESSLTGNAGDIAIQADSIMLDGMNGTGTSITSSTRGTGDAGALDILANEIVIQGGTNGFTGLSSSVDTPSSIVTSAMAGDVNVTTNSLSILDGGQISSGINTGSGHGGNISVTAGDIYISGLNSRGETAGISSRTAGNATGDAGNIMVTAIDLTLDGIGTIDSSSFSYGGGGDITVNAENVRIIGGGAPNRAAGLFAVSGRDASHGGNISVTADNLELVNGGDISNNTIGPGNAGNITLDVGRLLVTGVAEGGTVPVPSQIRSTTFVYPDAPQASGNGGNISITADSVEVSHSARITTASASSGTGGNTSITANTITVSDNGSITATGTNTGNAGNIQLTANDSLTLDNAEITTSANQSDGGDITIHAQRMVYLNNGSITTSVQGGDGNGGNIDIDPQFVVLNHSSISADAQGGNGGNITIVANNYLASADSSVTASSNLGIDGTVVVNAPNKDLNAELEAVPEPAPDAAQYFRNDCIAVGSGFSSFVSTHRSTATVGAKVFMPSRYATTSAHTFEKDVSDNKKTSPQKPVLILARKGIDCLARL